MHTEWRPGTLSRSKEKHWCNIMYKLTREPIEHSPDFAKCLKSGIHKAGPDCPCGIKEQHEHCKGCGKVVSIGSRKVIRKWKLKF